MAAVNPLDALNYKPVDRMFGRRGATSFGTKMSGGITRGYNFKDLYMQGVGRVRKVHHQIIVGEAVHITKWQQWTLTEMAYGAGTTMEIVVPIVGNIDLIQVSQDVMPLTLEVKTGLTNPNIKGQRPRFEQEFYGVIEDLKPGMKVGTLTITARTFANVLLIAKTAIDEKSTETVASAVKRLVQDHGMGLVPDVDPSFTQKVAEVYKEGLASTTKLMSVWNLLESYAQKVRAELYVRGKTLYFHKPSPGKVAQDDVTQIDPKTPTKYRYEWGVNVLDLDFEHAPLFNQDIKVEVTSYHSKTHSKVKVVKGLTDVQIKDLAHAVETHDPKLAAQVIDNANRNIAAKAAKKGRKFKRKKKNRTPRGADEPFKFLLKYGTGVADDNGAGGGQASRSTGRAHESYSRSSASVRVAPIRRIEHYVFQIPDADQETCERVAEQIMQDISHRELKATLTVLGQPNLTTVSFVQVKGTGNDVRDNTIYQPRQLVKKSVVPDSSGAGGGYTAVFTLVSHPPQSLGSALF